MYQGLTHPQRPMNVKIEDHLDTIMQGELSEALLDFAAAECLSDRAAVRPSLSEIRV